MMLLALPQPGPPPAADRRSGGAGGLDRLQFEQRAEREAQHAGAADAKDVAPARSQVSIAQILGFRTNDSEHG